MSGRGRDGRDLVAAGAIWFALSGLGEALVQLVVVGSFPVLASREGAVADEAIVFLLRVLVPVFAFVLVVIVYSMVRFRVAADDAEDSPRQARGDRRFALSWVGVTTALTVLVVVYPGITGLRSISSTRDEPRPLVVEVTAEQWQWSFRYPRLGIPAGGTLVLPVDRPVRFVLRSRDVVHSFWVPAFRIKEDVVPGETRDLYLTPDRIISTSTSPLARVQCAELCGVGHAEMRAPVRVVSQDAFTRWTAQARAGTGG